MLGLSFGIGQSALRRKKMRERSVDRGKLQLPLPFFLVILVREQPVALLSLTLQQLLQTHNTKSFFTGEHVIKSVAKTDKMLDKTFRFCPGTMLVP